MASRTVCISRYISARTQPSRSPIVSQTQDIGTGRNSKRSYVTEWERKLQMELPHPAVLSAPSFGETHTGRNFILPGGIRPRPHAHRIAKFRCKRFPTALAAGAYGLFYRSVVL